MGVLKTNLGKIGKVSLKESLFNVVKKRSIWQGLIWSAALGENIVIILALLKFRMHQHVRNYKLIYFLKDICNFKLNIVPSVKNKRNKSMYFASFCCRYQTCYLKHLSKNTYDFFGRKLEVEICWDCMNKSCSSFLK